MNNLAIVQVLLASLHPYAHNPRKNDEAVPRMVEVLQEFGFRVPSLAKSDGEIIDGHLPYKAAQAMGLTDVQVARAVEIAPAYIDVSLIRFGRLFPDVAITLKETGETFEAVAARRNKAT